MLSLKRPRSVACVVLSAFLSSHVLIHYILLKRDGKHKKKKVTSEILRAAVTVTIVIICNYNYNYIIYILYIYIIYYIYIYIYNLNESQSISWDHGSKSIVLRHSAEHLNGQLCRLHHHHCKELVPTSGQIEEKNVAHTFLFYLLGGSLKRMPKRGGGLSNLLGP